METYKHVLVLLTIVSLPLSISAVYVWMFLLAMVILLERKVRFHKDFLLFGVLYLWRLISNLVNGVSLKRLRDIWDKSGYIIYSNVRIDEHRLKQYLWWLATINSTMVLLALLFKFTPLGKYDAELYVCHDRCEIHVFNKTTFSVRAYGSSGYLYLIEDGDTLRFFVDKLFQDVKLKEGKYEAIFEGMFGFLVKNGDAVFENFTYREIFELTYLYDEYGKFVGFFKQKLIAAGYIFIVYTIMITFAIRKIVFFLLPALIMFIGLLLTGSKIYTFLALLILFMILLLERRFLWMILAVSVLALALPFMYVSGVLAEIFQEFANSLSLRMNFWKIGLDTFKENWLFGTGYYSIRTYLEKFVILDIIDNSAHVHNIYINALAETGLFGGIMVLIIMVYFTLKFIRWGLEGRDYMDTLRLSVGLVFLGLSISGIFENHFDQAKINVALGFFMGIASAKSSDE